MNPKPIPVSSLRLSGCFRFGLVKPGRNGMKKAGPNTRTELREDLQEVCGIRRIEIEWTETILSETNPSASVSIDFTQWPLLRARLQLPAWDCKNVQSRPKLEECGYLMLSGCPHRHTNASEILTHKYSPSDLFGICLTKTKAPRAVGCCHSLMPRQQPESPEAFLPLPSEENKIVAFERDRTW